jgi:hypothetical protein
MVGVMTVVEDGNVIKMNIGSSRSELKVGAMTQVHSLKFSSADFHIQNGGIRI